MALPHQFVNRDGRRAELFHQEFEGGILGLAATSSDLSRGMLLLGVYSAGLAVPFLLAEGAALLAQHLTTRPTEDLDFFTAPDRGHVPAACDALEAAAL